MRDFCFVGPVSRVRSLEACHEGGFCGLVLGLCMVVSADHCAKVFSFTFLTMYQIDKFLDSCGC